MKKPLERDVDCPDCGNKLRLKLSKHGWFYSCETWPACDCTHGCHQASGKPLGIPADKETRQWRVKAHKAFDRLWKGRRGQRQKMYYWLAESMGIVDSNGRPNPRKCHIGRFNSEQCKQVCKLAERKRQ